MGLHESGRIDQADRDAVSGSEDGHHAETLRALARSLLAVAQAIDCLPENARHELPQKSAPDRESARPSDPESLRRNLLDRAAQDYANRRARRQFFPAELFGEPAWDLLLDLFQARLEGKRISVTSACIGADVPLTTALRWIGVLEAEGLVERSRNLNDHRSTWGGLTDRATRAMTEYTQGCLLRGRRASRQDDERLAAILNDRAA